jgi:predicted small metal-binding protein
MAKVVNCPCGEVIKAETDDELVASVQKHGKEVHSQEASRDDILAMAQPAD